MAKTDSVLGRKVKEHLMTLGLETQLEEANYEVALEELRDGVHGFLANMGLDVDGDESIMDTPNRVAEMFTKELCAGLDYHAFPKCTTTPNGIEAYPGFEAYVDQHVAAWEGKKTREEVLGMEATKAAKRQAATSFGRVDEMVLVKKIRTVTLCEHHFQTIHGHTHIAYIPGKRLLGLSKFARVTEFFARRPQVQERMTEQVFAALSFILETDDIAVQQVAVHNCMRARGVMDPESDTTTSKMGGKFMSVPALRNEFLMGIR